MRRRLLPLLIALAGLGALPAAAPAALRFAPCAGASAVGCARVVVPLDRSGAVPGTLPLLVQRVPIKDTGRGVLLAVVGGPGESGSASLPDLALALSPALRGRDLVVFDQRGTGESGVLRCPALERAPGALSEPASTCATALGPARGLYTTPQSVEDLEAVREALGPAKISLYGVSYGARVVLAYARAHPEHVDRLVLDSPVGPAGPDPLMRSSFQAVGRVLRELCSRGDCRSVAPDPVGNLAALAAQIRAEGPQRASVYDARGRRTVRSLNEAGLFNLLVAGDVDPTLRADLPSAVRSGLNGDNAPILRLARRANVASAIGSIRAFSPATYAATICEEGQFPWDRGAGPEQRAAQARAAVDATPETTFAPFSRAVALASPLLDLCLRWPPASAPQPAPPAVLSSAPTLILAGRDDLRTPIEDAAGIAAGLPAARLVLLDQTGHSTLASDPTGCAGRELKAFFEDRPPRNCPASARLIKPAPVAPTALSRVKPARGMKGAPGQVAETFKITMEDALRQARFALLTGTLPARGFRGGGLRGGFFKLTRRSLKLSGYRYLPEVRLTFQISFTQTTRLKVRGRAAGELIVSPGGRVTGKLGSQKVRMSIEFPRPVTARGTRARGAGAGAAATGAAAVPRY